MHSLFQRLKWQTQSIDWQALLPTMLLAVFCWSFVPFAYAIQIKTTVFSHDLLSLFAYQACIWLAAVMIFDQQGGSFWSLIAVLASFLFAIGGFLHGNVFLFVLLLLPACYLLLLTFDWSGFQGILGLIAWGVMMTLSIPVVFTFIAVKFISWNYLYELVPLLAIYWFYSSPVFLPATDRKGMIEGIFGIILIITALTRPLKVSLIIGFLVIILSWWLMQKMAKMQHPLIFYVLLQLIAIIAIFWT